VPTTRYRWVVLGVGTAAQATVAAAMFSVAVLAPQLKAHFHLSIAQTGIALAALGIGMTPTLLPWGMLADRIGERIVLPLGLATGAVALACAGIARSYDELVVLLVVAGALSASVNAASGRAVMQWFDRSQRGLALGIRQANVPLGGLVAALALPPLADAAGLGWAFFAVAAACAAGALAGAVFVRSPAHGVGAESVAAESHPPPRSRPLRQRPIWLISWGSGLVVVGQVATMSFTVLFLHDGRGFSTTDAALVLAAAQVLGGALRIAAGHWSDSFGSRIVPLRWLALGVTAGLVVIGASAQAPAWILVPVLVLAGGIGLSWNGLSFVATAEMAGTAASGAALGFQQTFLGIAGIVAPIGFAALVSATSWRVAFIVSGLFPLLGWLAFRPLASATPRATQAGARAHTG
jgi:sugar phosphate permease